MGQSTRLKVPPAKALEGGLVLLGSNNLSFSEQTWKIHTYLVVHPTNRKWVITLVKSGLTPLIPLITRVITHLLSGMNHQVHSEFLDNDLAEI